MFRKHDMIPSQAMGRRIHLWRFGNFGAPVLVFPSASGMAHEWDANGMIQAVEPLIVSGKIKLYCVESNVAEAWTRKETDPAWRMTRHMAYEKFVIEELVPFIREDCRTPTIPIAATGVSMGAFYSINAALKFPETFRYALCMSGRYDMTWLTEGWTNQDLYFNNPVAYVPNMNGDVLEAVRRNTFIALVCGRGAWEGGNIEATEQMAAILAAKDVPHILEMWGRDSAHSWEWWQKQVAYHLANRFG